MLERSKIADQKLSLSAWYFALRWFAFLGQAFVLFLALFVFKLTLPIAGILFCLSIIPLSNIAAIYGTTHLNENKLISILLVLDTVILTAVLALSGGAVNPFSIFYLVHLVLAAVMLGTFWAWTMAGLSSIGFFLLFIISIPVPEWQHHNSNHELSLHLQGMLFSYIAVAFLLAYFLTRIIEELKNKQKRLQHLENLQNNQRRLAAITTATAGAAHELGTPLNTISLVVHELERSLILNSSKEEIAEDILLLKSQVQRCSEILGNLQQNSGIVSGESLEEVSFDLLVKEAIKSLSSFANLKFELNLQTVKLFIPKNSLTQAIKSLVKNAIEATSGSDKIINISAVYEKQIAKIEIKDQGQGMDQKTINRLGEPFFSTKDSTSGMGLGVYLAKLTAEQLGGSLNYYSEIGKGTTACLEFRPLVNI